MENPFSEAIKGVRTKLTKAIDVSDLLLGDLVDKTVINQVQYDLILVRCFAVFIVYCWSTLFLCITSGSSRGGSFPGPRDVLGARNRSKILKSVFKMASF